jgi:hypothetical protein
VTTRVSSSMISNMFSSSLYGRRMGRVVFGAVLFAGAGVFVHQLAQGRAFDGEPDAPFAPASVILLATWALAIVAGAITTIALRKTARDPRPVFAASMVVPSVAIALLAPLTLHLPFVGGGRDFDEWASLSLPITGVTHVLLAVLVAMRAYQLVAGGKAIRPGSIYLVCVAVSCLPFAVLYLLPPALVALTGLPFLPAMAYMQRLVERERAREELEGVLPRATATLGVAA